MKYSIILPTLNEEENISPLISGILNEKIPDLEILIVDDHSSDGTQETGAKLEKQYPGQVRFLSNPGKKGLSPSVVFGFSEAKGDILLCMDADGQHRPEDIRGIFNCYERENACEMAIGSRYAPGGGFAEKWNFFRVLMSRTASAMAHLALRVEATDPMSGFFSIRRTSFEKIKSMLNPDGFKVMLEMLFLLKLSDKQAVVREQGIVFGLRKHGKSKISPRIVLRYLLMLRDCVRKRRLFQREKASA